MRRYSTATRTPTTSSTSRGKCKAGAGGGAGAGGAGAGGDGVMAGAHGTEFAAGAGVDGTEFAAGGGFGAAFGAAAFGGDRFGQRANRIIRQTGQHKGCAVFGKQMRLGNTLPSGRTGDQNNFACQTLCHRQGPSVQMPKIPFGRLIWARVSKIT